MAHPDPALKKDLYEPTHGGKVLSMAPGLGKHSLLVIISGKSNRLSKKFKKSFSFKSGDGDHSISGCCLRHSRKGYEFL